MTKRKNHTCFPLIERARSIESAKSCVSCVFREQRLSQILPSISSFTSRLKFHSTDCPQCSQARSRSLCMLGVAEGTDFFRSPAWGIDIFACSCGGGGFFFRPSCTGDRFFRIPPRMGQLFFCSHAWGMDIFASNCGRDGFFFVDLHGGRIFSYPPA